MLGFVLLRKHISFSEIDFIFIVLRSDFDLINSIQNANNLHKTNRTINNPINKILLF